MAKEDAKMNVCNYCHDEWCPGNCMEGFLNKGSFNASADIRIGPPKEDAKMNVCGYCGDEQGRATTFSKGVSPGPSVISEQTKIDLIIKELTFELEETKKARKMYEDAETKLEIMGEITGLGVALSIVKRIKG